MQTAVEFITRMSSLAFDELVANLPFTDIVALARTNRELYERLTGGLQPPTSPEQHAIHSSGRAYAWQGLLDKLGNTFGIHTEPDKCRHPNPALRKKVAISMRQYINNDADDPVLILRNELDQIAAQFYDTDVTPNGGSNNGAYSTARYLSWRRTVVLFQLLASLEKTAQRAMQYAEWYSGNRQTLSFGNRNTAFWGVVARAEYVFGPTHMFSVTDFVNMPADLSAAKLVKNQIILLQENQFREHQATARSGCIFVYDTRGGSQRKYGTVYVDPKGSGDETLMEMNLDLENVHFSAQYVNRNEQDVNDVDIVFMLTFYKDERQFYGWWTPGKSVQLIVGENITIPPTNQSDFAEWYEREPNVTVNRVNLDMFKFQIGPNPYVAVFSRISDRLNTVVSYLPVGNANNRLKPLFRSQQWFVKDANSPSNAITFSDPRVSPFVYNRMRTFDMFSPIEKDQTFWFLGKRAFLNLADIDVNDGLVQTNVIVDVAKFKRGKLEKRLSFVIGNKAYISGVNRQSYMLGDGGLRFRDNKLYLDGAVYNKAENDFFKTFIVIDVTTQRIVTAILKPSDNNDNNNNSLQDLALAVDDYTLPNGDANRQRRVQ